MLAHDINSLKRKDVIIIEPEKKEKRAQMKRSRASFSQHQLAELERRFSIQR